MDSSIKIIADIFTNSSTENLKLASAMAEFEINRRLLVSEKKQESKKEPRFKAHSECDCPGVHICHPAIEPDSNPCKTFKEILNLKSISDKGDSKR